jgi:MFS family permease
MWKLPGVPTSGISHTPRRVRAMPVWPLAATLAVQTLATMAMLSIPAVAPAIARDLGVSATLVGTFVSLVYTVGIVSALGSPGFVHRYGAVRVSQLIMLSVVAMLICSASGTLTGLAAGAVLLGLGYGANAPAGTHLLVPQTPRGVFNMVMSLRQIGIPLGGVLGSLLVPPLTIAAGWRLALLIELIPALLLGALLQAPRGRWDVARNPRHRLPGVRGLIQPFRMLQEDARLVPLSAASFLYAGVQLCFMAFMTVDLTSVVGFRLVAAGEALASYQVAGAVSRPLWGWVADRFITPTQVMVVQGVIMAGAAVAAAQFGPHWPIWAVLAVAVLAGASASGYTGIAYAEYARLGGVRWTEATALGTAVMFFGVTVIPSAFGAMVTVVSGYRGAYLALAVLALTGAAWLWMPARQP